MTIGERIKAAREKAGLTQQQVADRLGVSSTYISQYERDVRTPKPATVIRLANAIGVALDQIVIPDKEYTDLFIHMKVDLVMQISDILNTFGPLELEKALDAVKRIQEGAYDAQE